MATQEKPTLKVNNVIQDKSAVSVAVATLLLLFLSFFAIRYFNKTENTEGSINGDGLSTRVDDLNKDTSSKDSDSMVNKDKNSDQEVVIGTGGSDFNSSTWVATDYQPSSKTGDTHTVQSGDTLWEIAEAYTGNGANWTQIAQANNVSYLSNGNPLIMPGQVLTIPSGL